MGEIRKICSRGSLALEMPTSEDLAASRALIERHLLVRAVDEIKCCLLMDQKCGPCSRALHISSLTQHMAGHMCSAKRCVGRMLHKQPREVAVLLHADQVAVPGSK